jgi:hypothetical protein
VSVAKGDQLFFEVQSDDSLGAAVAWAPRVTYTEYCKPDVSDRTVCAPVSCSSDENGNYGCMPENLTYLPEVQSYYTQRNK